MPPRSTQNKDASKADRSAEAAARFYIPQCEKLRLKAHLSRTKLAQISDVDRSRVAAIEKHIPVTEIIARKVFDALALAHSDITLEYEEIVLERG